DQKNDNPDDNFYRCSIACDTYHHLYTIGDTVFQWSGEGRPPRFDRSSGPPKTVAFRIVQAVVTGTILFWLGIGIRQWFVFKMD
ncbi:MAG: hypothetical protein ACJ70X_05365, partial [Nitrososphaera sp.]